MQHHKSGIFPISILILAAFFSVRLQAQTVLLSVDRSSDSLQTNFGPNKKTFVNFYFRGGMVAGSDCPGARLKTMSSGEYGFGLRIKRKLNRSLAYGFDLQWQNLIFKLDQEHGKRFPDTVLHNVERYDLASVRTGAWFRINFDKDRGNSMGKFMDFVVSAEALTAPKHITKDDQPDGSLVKRQEKQLPYIEPFQAHLGFRVGSGRFIAYLNYRLTPLFGKEYAAYDFPLFTAGVDVSIF